MSRGWKIAIGLVLALVVAYVGLVLGLMALAGRGISFDDSGGTVGVIRLDGVIAADASGGAFSTGGIDPVFTAGLLEEADADTGIDAVVLRVNSPGGSPAASWEVYRAIQQMEKPVIVSVGDVAASGAYYFASAADAIVAAPTSQVGSIGVILAAADLEGLFEKLGIRYTVLTKGEHKDLGAPNREMTDEEKDLLLAQMDDIYEQFIADVAEGRGLPPAEVRELATGQTFGGTEAVDLGLVDMVGTYGEALDEAALAAGLDPESYGVSYLGEDYGFSLLQLLLGAEAKQVLQGLGQEVASGFRKGLEVGERPFLK